MPQLSFQGGLWYLLAEHPTSAGRIYPNFGFFKFQLWTPKSWYLATGVPADMCKWDHGLLLCEPIAKSARKRARDGWRRGAEQATRQLAELNEVASPAPPGSWGIAAGSRRLGVQLPHATAEHCHH